MAVDDQCEISFFILQGTLPWQPILWLVSQPGGLCPASSYPPDAMQARVLAMTLCRVYLSSVAEYYSYHRALL